MKALTSSRGLGLEVSTKNHFYSNHIVIMENDYRTNDVMQVNDTHFGILRESKSVCGYGLTKSEPITSTV